MNSSPSATRRQSILARQIMKAIALIACTWLGVTADRAAQGATLQELLAGASLDAGATRFRDWSLVGLDSTTTPAPNLAQIVVQPLIDDSSRPGVEFISNGPLATTGINAIDLLLQFRVDVHVGGASLTGQTLELPGVTFGGEGGLAYLSQETDTLSGVELASTVAIADNASDVFQLTSTSSFVPRLSVRATANVFVTGMATTDAVNVTRFRVRMSQTGPFVVPGDFDRDGDVDSVDLNQWKGDFGVNGDSNSDGDGDSDGADFLIWQRNAAIPQPGIMAVPEPSTAALALMFAALCGMRRRAGGVRS